MDRKISEFAPVTDTIVADIIPIASGGVNRSMTVGVLAMNLPNVGNKGISKNVVTPPNVLVIPLTATLVNLPLNASPYTLAAGTDGQLITVVSGFVNTLSIASGSVSTVTFAVDGTVSLRYMTALSKWVVVGQHNVTLG